MRWGWYTTLCKVRNEVFAEFVIIGARNKIQLWLERMRLERVWLERMRLERVWLERIRLERMWLERM